QAEDGIRDFHVTGVQTCALPIFAVGDGGFTMLLGEFMTSIEHKLPIKVVVFNNREWGLVHLEMEEAGLPAFDGSNFPNMDFAARSEERRVGKECRHRCREDA